MKEQLINKVVSAMETGELQAYYQPQYNAKRGVIGGAEALVRWVKPDGEVIPPAKFIPELEEKGQVSLVDWFVAEEACKMINELGDKAVRISVNFGREHARDKHFIEKLDRLLGHFGIDKELFGVEITESDVATDKRRVINWVKELEAAGYMVSIDDFGSGMSSLSFVKDIPAQVLKIDRSFLNDNCQTERGRMTLESVFYFAHRLKLTTVVEGVETEEQLQFINTCDCDYIQGFIFSKPVAKDEFLKMCREEAPVEMDLPNPFENQAMFGQVRVLIESVYKKFPVIVFSNLSKNAYQIMRKENFIEMSIPSTGSYDKGFEHVKGLSSEEDQEALEEAFSRENLLAAYKRGDRRVIRIVRQRDKEGNSVRVAIEDYFIEHPSSNDIYMVSFAQPLNFDEKVYIGKATARSI